MTDKNELIELWRSLKKWSKTHWHDDKMKNKKYFHKAEDVFSITLIHDIKSDISWKFAQHKSKEIKFEEACALGEWDSLTQQELKKIINSLVQLENNPKISKQINQILEQVKPMLADSMAGKKVLKDFQKEVEKASKILYKSFTTVRIDFNQWYADFLSKKDLK